MTISPRRSLIAQSARIDPVSGIVLHVAIEILIACFEANRIFALEASGVGVVVSSSGSLSGQEVYMYWGSLYVLMIPRISPKQYPR